VHIFTKYGVSGGGNYLKVLLISCYVLIRLVCKVWSVSCAFASV